MEESNAWRHPVDLVAILERAFEVLPAALETGRGRRGTWAGHDALVPVVLGEDAEAIADGLLGARLDVWSELDSGKEVELSIAASVAYATSPPSHRSRLSGQGAELKWSGAQPHTTVALQISFRGATVRVNVSAAVKVWLPEVFQ